MNPSVFSQNSGSPNVVIEIYEGFLLSFDYNKNKTTNLTHHIVYDLLKSNILKKKIEFISGDYSNKNLIIKYENSNTLSYVYRNKDEFISSNISKKIY